MTEVLATKVEEKAAETVDRDAMAVVVVALAEMVIVDQEVHAVMETEVQEEMLVLKVIVRKDLKVIVLRVTVHNVLRVIVRKDRTVTDLREIRIVNKDRTVIVRKGNKADATKVDQDAKVNTPMAIVHKDRANKVVAVVKTEETIAEEIQTSNVRMENIHVLKANRLKRVS